MKDLTMLTVVINALVQQEEMVTVIACLKNRDRDRDRDKDCLKGNRKEKQKN